jgi:hypothetical protein
MSLDPELGPAHTEYAARPAPVPVRYSAARHANHVDESPELLRWRADLLMDEMMLGGVDVSAADSAAPRSAERDGSRFDPGYGQPPAAEPPRSEPERRESPTYPSPSANRRVELPPASAAPRIAPPHQNSDERHGDEIAANRDEAHANGDYRNGSGSGEHRRPPVRQEPARQEPTSYRQERADVAANQSPRDGEARREPPVARPEPERNPEPRPAVRPTSPPVDAHTQWAQSSEKWDWQDFSGQELVPEDDIPAPFTEYRPQERASSAVRQDSADFVNAMAVMGGKRRSTLLPRMSSLDPEALNREIAELHGAIAALLPVGHETGERARHLLDKAYSILQSDPLRSAEVEYYMQQVRTIVQRLRQTRTWSDLYRDRLRVYLLSWLAFSAVIFAARYLFETQMIAAATEWLGSGLLPHWAPFWGAAAAGALGGAAGALYTMQLHAASGDSFFDRKYGLRGLMLPIIGLTVGGLGYLLFGGTYVLAGVNPATNGIAGTLPALAALIFGVSQESIYGTRG